MKKVLEQLTDKLTIQIVSLAARPPTQLDFLFFLSTEFDGTSAAHQHHHQIKQIEMSHLSSENFPDPQKTVRMSMLGIAFLSVCDNNNYFKACSASYL